MSLFVHFFFNTNDSFPMCCKEKRLVWQDISKSDVAYYYIYFVCNVLRYKNELDRSQPANSSALSSSSSELHSYNTPQKSFATPAPASAYKHQGISNQNFFFFKLPKVIIFIMVALENEATFLTMTFYTLIKFYIFNV